MNNEKQAHSSDGRVFWTVVWPICTAVLGSLCTWFFVQQQRESDLAMRPPIAVMNVSDWLLSAGTGSTDAERFKDGGDRADAAAQKLESQGVLVLDARIVRGSPAAVKVSAPEAPRR